jgi:hypothetical protein
MAAETIVEDGGEAIAIAMDVSKPDSFAAAVKATVGTYGSPADDFLIRTPAGMLELFRSGCQRRYGHRAAAGLVVP